MADTTRALTDEPAVPAARIDGSRAPAGESDGPDAGLPPRTASEATPNGPTAAVGAAAASADPGGAPAAGEPVADPAQVRAGEDAAPARLLVSYGRSLSVFVGAGLIAGAVVHFPLAPIRYAALGLVGAVLFAAGSTSADIARRSRAARVAHVAASLGMAVGVGMVAGGVQHFSDIPGRAAVLIPLGLVVGLAAFAVRDGHRLARRHVVPLVTWSVTVAVALGTGLAALTPAEEARGSHGHAHGAGGSSAASTDGHPHSAAAPRAGDAGRRAARAGGDDAAPPPRSGARSGERKGMRSLRGRAQRPRAAAGTRARRTSTRATRDAGRRRARQRLTDDEILAAVRALEAKYVPRGG